MSSKISLSRFAQKIQGSLVFFHGYKLSFNCPKVLYRAKCYPQKLGAMKKEELLHIHLFLAQVMKYFEENGLNCDFKRYRELEISPFQIHRSKEEHKQAIFVLGIELAALAVKKTETRS